MRSPSLTRSLFLRIMPMVLLAIFFIGMLAFKSATRQIQTAYDAQLISSANLMWLVAEDQLNDAEPGAFRRIQKLDFSSNDGAKLGLAANDHADDRMFRVWRGKRLVMVSNGAPGTVVPLQPPGFSTVLHKKEPWRIYSLPIPDTRFVIEAGEKISLRHELVSNILFGLSTSLLLLAPVLALLLWYGIGTGLATIRALIEQIRYRSPDDLSPLGLGGMPRDLVPLGQSINQLLIKLTRSFTAERRFAEHAAHHLRTPLAALKLQVQLLAQLKDEKSRAALLNDLSAAIDRASQLVGQLLTSTRVSHQPIVRVTLSWRQLCVSLLEELAPLAAQKNITLSFESDGEVEVMADETLLRLITGNTLENAIKYTPENGSVALSLATEDAFVRYAVADSGPGIPEEERKLVFERFYRVGTPKVVGTGLGLAIVAESVARLVGRITLASSEQGGLLVEIRLPRA